MVPLEVQSVILTGEKNLHIEICLHMLYSWLCCKKCAYINDFMLLKTSTYPGCVYMLTNYYAIYNGIYECNLYMSFASL